MSRKKLKGKIKALSGEKTVSVEVVRTYHHPVYKKRIRTSKKYLAHLEGEASIGQEVIIEESRPISRRKRWRVIEIAGKQVGVEQPEDSAKKEVVKKQVEKSTKPKTKKRSKT